MPMIPACRRQHIGEPRRLRRHIALARLVVTPCDQGSVERMATKTRARMDRREVGGPAGMAHCTAILVVAHAKATPVDNKAIEKPAPPPRKPRRLVAAARCIAPAGCSPTRRRRCRIAKQWRSLPAATCVTCSAAMQVRAPDDRLGCSPADHSSIRRKPTAIALTAICCNEARRQCRHGGDQIAVLAVDERFAIRITTVMSAPAATYRTSQPTVRSLLKTDQHRTELWPVHGATTTSPRISPTSGAREGASNHDETCIIAPSREPWRDSPLAAGETRELEH
jgi:hypothetical protein